MLVSFKVLLSDECIFVVDYDFDFVVSLLLYEVLPTLGLESHVCTCDAGFDPELFLVGC